MTKISLDKAISKIGVHFNHVILVTSLFSDFVFYDIPRISWNSQRNTRREISKNLKKKKKNFLKFQKFWKVIERHGKVKNFFLYLVIFNYFFYKFKISKNHRYFRGFWVFFILFRIFKDCPEFLRFSLNLKFSEKKRRNQRFWGVLGLSKKSGIQYFKTI